MHDRLIPRSRIARSTLSTLFELFTLVMPLLALIVLEVGCTWTAGPDNQASRPTNRPHEQPATPKHVDARLIFLPTLADQQPVDLPGLHNVVAFADHYYSGSVPEGEIGFEALRAMGVKTIISVDAAPPDIELAERFGLRYIHLPIGYNGFDKERRLQLAKASHDAISIGPVYIHCHHGKHRSAGAAATVAATLGWANNEAMIERMHVAGTSVSYPGLFEVARNASVVSMTVLEQVNDNFPSATQPQGLVKGMVEIDHVFTHLVKIENAGWQVPPDHPDLVPAAEAGRLADVFRLLQTDADTDQQDETFAELLAASQAIAQQIEDELTVDMPDLQRLSLLMAQLSHDCRHCHVRYRD